MDWLTVEEIFSLKDFSNGNTMEFEHPDLTKRLKKTLYYSPHKNPSKDTLSFPLTKAAVESFRKAAPTPCGKLGPRYASRVARDACLSPCAMILSLIYVERLIHNNPEYLQRIQSSDLFLISMMIASKYLYDEGMSDEVYNDEWAISGQVDTDYVNELEAEFLHAIQWKIFTKKEEFYEGLSLLEAKLAFLEGRQRGWLTYTELYGMLESKQINKNLQKIATLFAKALCLSVMVYSGLVVISFGLAALVRHPMVHPQKEASSNISSKLNDSQSGHEIDLVADQACLSSVVISFELTASANPPLSSSTPHPPHCRFARKKILNLTQVHHSMSPCVQCSTISPFCRQYNVTFFLANTSPLNVIPSPKHQHTIVANKPFVTGSDPPIPSFAGVLSLQHFPLFYQQTSTLPTGKVF